MRRFTVIVATLVTASTMVACSDTDESTTITVYAAASLTDAFTALADAFESGTPGVDVELSFAGSSSLREQILDGAPADVFVSANEQNMQQLVDAEVIDDPQAVLTNTLQIAVPAGNPAGITGLEDLGDDSLLIGLCAEEVPCGDFARQALEAAGVAAAPDTYERDVRALLTKVIEGELDAGIVYTTDVISAGDDVEGIDIPTEFNVVATFPIGIVSSSDNPELAAAFVEFALSGGGQHLLDGFGFASP